MTARSRKREGTTFAEVREKMAAGPLRVPDDLPEIELDEDDPIWSAPETTIAEDRPRQLAYAAFPGTATDLAEMVRSVVAKAVEGVAAQGGQPAAVAHALDDVQRQISLLATTEAAAFLASHMIPLPRRKVSVHLRIDADVLEAFKARGPGHLTRMNDALRAHIEQEAPG